MEFSRCLIKPHTVETYGTLGVYLQSFVTSIHGSFTCYVEASKYSEVYIIVKPFFDGKKKFPETRLYFFYWSSFWFCRIPRIGKENNTRTLQTNRHQ